MKRSLSLVLCGITVLVVFPSLSLADDFPLPSKKWKNQLKSTFEITCYDAETGAIAGTYTEGEGLGTYPFKGTINFVKNTKEKRNILISITVNWKDKGAITAWTGSYDPVDGNEQTPLSLIMNWHLVRSDNVSYVWQRILSGQDRFRPAE
jgi:hypothetical protein